MKVEISHAHAHSYVEYVRYAEVENIMKRNFLLLSVHTNVCVSVGTFY